MLSAAAFFGSMAVGILLLAGFGRLLEAPVLMRTNYAGRSVPTSAGMIFAPAYCVVYVFIKLFTDVSSRHSFGLGGSLLILTLGMCLLGFLDDMLGDRGTRGFRGHFESLLKGRFTTGFIKALGGFFVALAASLPFSLHLWDAFLNAALIALCANLFNLLDMRPGRALKVLVPALGAVIAVTWRLGDAFIPYALSIGAVALVLLPGDLRERFMIGDAGSNVLGATVGLGLAAGLGVWWRLGLAVSFAVLNLLSERFSFSSAIEGNRVLAWLDGLGRKGETEPGANYN
jgi:hypothetical protein